jgi:hypothetical protein
VTERTCCNVFYHRLCAEVLAPQRHRPSLRTVKGHRHYLGKWNTQASKERYAAFVAELAVSPAPTMVLRLATPAQFTVVELVDAYLDFAQGYYQKNGTPIG